jgi:hypothetical protein
VVGGSAPTTCTLSKTMAKVEVTADLVPACTNCTSSQQVAHVHLAISGVELHSGAVADRDSPDWQELAPDLAKEPRTFDLAADSGSGESAAALTVAGKIPAGTYYQLRLRLAGPSSPRTDQGSVTQSCGSVHGSCVVSAAGDVRALQTLDGEPYLRVELASPIDIRAEQLNQLHLEFSPGSALRKSSDGTMEVAPLLHGRMGSRAAN